MEGKTTGKSARSKRNTIKNEAWLEAVRDICLGGAPLSSVPRKLEERGFQGISKNTLYKYIRAGLIPGLTEEKHTAAVKRHARARAAYKQDKSIAAWVNYVGLCLKAGYPISRIEKELGARHMFPTSAQTIRNRLKEGCFPGVSEQSYEEAKERYKKNEYQKWCAFVRPLLKKGTPINLIEQALYAAGMTNASETTIRTRLKRGEIPGISFAEYKAASVRENIPIETEEADE